jgi:hypothetical protein
MAIVRWWRGMSGPGKLLLALALFLLLLSVHAFLQALPSYQTVPASALSSTSAFVVGAGYSGVRISQQLPAPAGKLETKQATRSSSDRTAAVIVVLPGAQYNLLVINSEVTSAVYDGKGTIMLDFATKTADSNGGALTYLLLIAK